MIRDFVLALKYLFDMQDSTTLLQRPTSDQMTWNRYFKTIKQVTIPTYSVLRRPKRDKKNEASRTISEDHQRQPNEVRNSIGNYEFIVSHSSLLVRQVFCSKRFVTLLFFWHSSKQLSLELARENCWVCEGKPIEQCALRYSLVHTNN